MPTGTQDGRKRLYLDFDGYFAAVEEQASPALHGRPVAVLPYPEARTCAICGRDAAGWKTDRHRRVMRLCLLPAALLWTTVFAGQWLLCRAVGLDVALADLLFAAAGGSLLTALPIQSIGGFGLMEAGFTGILAWLGAPAAAAALAALTIRFATWMATGVFFVVVVVVVAGVMTGPTPVKSPRS